MSKVLEETKHCPDCGAGIGDKHDGGCDVARCLWDGHQRLMCRWFGSDPVLVEHDCGVDVWTGLWPGEVEAAEFGWWVYWDGPCLELGWDYRGGKGWVRTTVDHPRAVPDLNRLCVDARWDRKSRRWVYS